MKASVFLETILITIADPLADADHMELIALVAPLAFTDDYSFLLCVLIGKVGISILDKNNFIVEFSLFNGKCRTDNRLQRLTGKLNTRIPLNVRVSFLLVPFWLLTLRDLFVASKQLFFRLAAPDADLLRGSFGFTHLDEAIYKAALEV